MSERLPVHIDPLTAANRGRKLKGHLPVQAFDRLGHWLHSADGELVIALEFGRDAAGRRKLAATVQGELGLMCERCLRPFALELDLAMQLLLVESEAEADTLPDEAEPLIVGDVRSMHVTDMIEDDLILALPVVPRCGRADCRSAVELVDSDETETETAARQRPFADLDWDA